MSGHLKSAGGICKIVGIILGIVVLGLESYAFDKTKDILNLATLIPGINWTEGLEATLIAFTVICLIGTGVCLFLRISQDSGMIKTLDMGFHLLGGVMLIIGSICLFYAAIHVDSKSCKESGSITSSCRKEAKFYHKLSAASLAIVDAIVYFVIGIMAKKDK